MQCDTSKDLTTLPENIVVGDLGYIPGMAITSIPKDMVVFDWQDIVGDCQDEGLLALKVLLWANSRLGEFPASLRNSG